MSTSCVDLFLPIDHFHTMAYLVYLVYGNEVKLKEEQATISLLIKNDFGITITNQFQSDGSPCSAGQ